ncbi:hypothetical protein ECTW07793_3620 [Escherichia coli TW07793]|nr:hypothetical protein ECTW07793_3620 [Escherichia coli TW07793]KDZ51222.1 hypothetical protein AB16_2317 [Escherichia coli 3-073-06_S1_C1]
MWAISLQPEHQLTAPPVLQTRTLKAFMRIARVKMSQNQLDNHTVLAGYKTSMSLQ